MIPYKMKFCNPEIAFLSTISLQFSAGEQKQCAGQAVSGKGLKCHQTSIIIFSAKTERTERDENMNLLLKWLLTLIENQEIIKYVVPGVAVICVMGLAYHFLRSIKMLLGIGMVILILLVFAR